jgi:endo-beta-N-acetylglucosaminidase D
MYFDDKNRIATIYGFNGYFRIEKKEWHENNLHLKKTMRKLITKPQSNNSSSISD